MAERIGIQSTLGIEAAVCAAGIVAALAYLAAQRRPGHAQMRA
jgi:hypothetical protein